jgi:hypothetical protein
MLMFGASRGYAGQATLEQLNAVELLLGILLFFLKKGLTGRGFVL